MRIGMVLQYPYPADIRVNKEVHALLGAGYAVHLLAYSRGRAEPCDEDLDGLGVHRIPPERWQLGPAGRLWNALRFSFAFHDGYWAGQIERFARDQAVDVLHVHDLPLVGTAVAVGRRLGIPVVADLHENMPAAIHIGRSSLSPLKRLIHAVVRNDHLWRRYERRILPHCARAIVVVPEAAERLIRYGLSPEQVVLVSNTEDETTFVGGPPDPEIQQRYQGQWVLSYVGGIGPHRGIDTAIRALPLAAPYIPNLHLLIVGVRRDKQFRALERLIRRVGAERWIEVIGWQPFDKVNSYIAVSAACLVPHNACEHTHTTVPHKLFQAMIAGKPVVVSDVRPLKRIVEETQSGLVFEAGNAESLARVLVRLSRDPDLVQQLGHNGQQAARGPYAWRHDAARLVAMYQELDHWLR